MNKMFLAVLLALAPLVMAHAADQIPASAPTPVSAVASAVASVALADAGLPPDAAPPSVAPSAAPSAVASLPANPEDLGAVLQAGRVNGWPLPYLLALLTALCTALIAIARNAGFLTSKNGPVVASVLVGVVYGTVSAFIVGGWEAALMFALAGPGSVGLTKVIRLIRPEFSSGAKLQGSSLES